MMPQQVRLTCLFLRGFGVVLFCVSAVSVMCMWVLQVFAMMFGESYDWGMILQSLMLYLTFLVLFPGQTVWTYRVKDRSGRWLTIVGQDS